MCIFTNLAFVNFLKITDEQMLLSCQNCIQLRFSSNELVFHWNYEKIGLLFPWDWDMMWFHKNHQFDSVFTVCFLDQTDSRLNFKKFWQLLGVHNNIRIGFQLIFEKSCFLLARNCFYNDMPQKLSNVRKCDTNN